MVTKAVFKPSAANRPQGSGNRGGPPRRPVPSRPTPSNGSRRGGRAPPDTGRRMPNGGRNSDRGPRPPRHAPRGGPPWNPPRGGPPSVPSGISGWVWIPAGSDLPRGGKDRGKGKDRSRGWDEGKGRGKDRGTKGKGRERGREAPPVKTKFKGKGKSTGPVKSEKQMETLKKIRSWDVAKKAWVGGLSKKTTWKTLKKHFEDSDLKPELVDVNERKGTAVVCFNEEDDVQTAVTALNGSELDEKTIEVDVWEKTPKEEKPEGEGEDGEKKPRRKRVKKPKFNIKNMLKGKSGKPTSKIAEKLKAIDSSLKVWVGGLKEGTTFKEISKHFEEQFAKPHLIDLLPKNCAVVTFKETDEVASAIAIVNNTELNGSNLEVDAWTKPERKERKMKVKKEKEEVKDED